MRRGHVGERGRRRGWGELELVEEFDGSKLREVARRVVADLQEVAVAGVVHLDADSGRGRESHAARRAAARAVEDYAASRIGGTG